MKHHPNGNKYLGVFQIPYIFNFILVQPNLFFSLRLTAISTTIDVLIKVTCFIGGGGPHGGGGYGSGGYGGEDRPPPPPEGDHHHGKRGGGLLGKLFGK